MDALARPPDSLRAPTWRRPLRLPAALREHRAALLGLGLLVLALFPGPALGRRFFYLRDIHLQWQGQVESFVRSIASGSLPVWDPCLSFGVPLWANANNQVLYPPTWLNLLVQPWTYFNVYVLLHALLAGLGTYALALELGRSRGAALVTAAAWITSGPFLSAVNLWNHFAAAAWVPWILLATLRGLRQRRLGDVVALGLALAAPVLAGSPDLLAFAMALSGAWIAADLLRAREAPAVSRGAVVLGAAGAVLVAAALTAGQWIPTLDTARRAARWSLSSEQQSAWALHPFELAEALLPFAWRDLPLLPQGRFAFAAGREPLLFSLYLGLPAAALVATGLAWRGLAHRWRLGLVVAAAAVWSLGSRTPLRAIVVAALPPLGALRFPSKAMVVGALAWALLAGAGWDAWREALSDGRTPRLGRGALVGVVLVGLLALAVHLTWVPGSAGATGTRLGLFLSVGLTVGIFVLATSRRGSPAARAAAVAALVVLDLFLPGSHVNPTAPGEFYRFRPPVVDFVRTADGRRLFVHEYDLVPGESRRRLGRDQPYLMRVPAESSLQWVEALGMRAYLVNPTSAVWRLENSYDLDSVRLFPSWLARLTDAVVSSTDDAQRLRLLRLAAVGRVVALHGRGYEPLEPVTVLPGSFPEPIRVFAVPDALPRATVVGRARVVADDERALSAVASPTFRADSEVILSDGEERGAAEGFSGEARIVETRPDGMTVDVAASHAAYLVTADTYDPGWRARVDGVAAPVRRADVAFRAVAVPPGRHRVELAYRPPAVAAGCAVSAASLVVLAVGALVAGRRRSLRASLARPGL